MNFNFEAFAEKANSLTITDTLNQIKGGCCDQCHHDHHKCSEVDVQDYFGCME